MEIFAASPLSTTQGLLGSIWDQAGLGADVGLADLLDRFRSGAGSSGGLTLSLSELDLSSISDSQFSQTLNQPEVTGRGTAATGLERDRLSDQPRLALSADELASSRSSRKDSLTGLVETAAPLALGIQSTAAATPLDIKVNFQPQNATVPTGYQKDFGQAYNASQGFGWVRQNSLNLSSANHAPVNITANSRDRNREGGIDQRLDTLIHMQGNHVPHSNIVKTAAAWEYAVPDGKYSVAVSVGDQSSYDSSHKIRLEEGKVTVIKPFRSTANHEYERGTATVTVTDGRLTVDAIGGTNTKINYIEIKSVSPGAHPRISGSAPFGRQPNISRSAAVNLDLALVATGAGVDATTLSVNNVRLYRTYNNTTVPGTINTSGGGDAIVYQPNNLLAPLTNYTLRIGDGVKDEDGKTFIPFSTTFTTGTGSVPQTPGVNFVNSNPYSNPADASDAPISSLVVSPNGSKLYAAALDGNLRRWTINPNGTLTNRQTFSGLAGPDPTRPRAIIGLTFDPSNPRVLWVTQNDTIIPDQPAEDFTGKISKLTLQSGSGFDASIQDYVVGLPRSAKDHLSNSLAFGPDSKLYLTQGSNSAMGAPDQAWGPRGERLLTAAVLQIDPDRNPTNPFNVRTEGRGADNYNPYAPNAPVKLYATGVRNAYDLVWHSSGRLYTPTNGSAANGNTPDDPRTPANEGLTKVATQNDYLFKVVPGGYYGHPNPKRQEYVMNGGNPTIGKDPAEVVDEGVYNGYNVGVDPDPSYQYFAYDFGRNRSPNGVIEYRGNTFGGALKNQLLVVEFSGGDDILALKLKADGNVSSAGVTQVASGFTNPLDLAEGQNGNLYVAELVDEDTGQGRIRLLRPN